MLRQWIISIFSKTFLYFDWMWWLSHCFRKVIFSVALQWINESRFHLALFPQTRVSLHQKFVMLGHIQKLFSNLGAVQGMSGPLENSAFKKTSFPVNLAADYNISKSDPLPEPDSKVIRSACHIISYFVFHKFREKNLVVCRLKWECTWYIKLAEGIHHNVTTYYSWVVSSNWFHLNCLTVLSHCE